MCMLSADTVTAVTCDDAVLCGHGAASASWVPVSMACETSVSRLPGIIAAMPASMDEPGGLGERRVGRDQRARRRMSPQNRRASRRGSHRSRWTPGRLRPAISVGGGDAVHHAVVDRRADAARETRGSRGTTGYRRRRESPPRRWHRVRASTLRVERPGRTALKRGGDQRAGRSHGVEFTGTALRDDPCVHAGWTVRSSDYLTECAQRAGEHLVGGDPMASTVLSSDA